MSKSEWEKMMMEEKEHGNKLLNNRKFNKKSYGAAKMADKRKKEAEEKLMLAKNNGDKKGANQALNTINSMRQNGTLKAGNLYRNAQIGLSNANISAPAKAPKVNKSNTCTPKNGIFIN